MESFVTICLLISTLMLFRLKKAVEAVGIIFVQSLALALVSLIIWTKTGLLHLLIAGILTLCVKAILIPLVLYFTIKKTANKKRIDHSLGPVMSLFIAFLLVMIGQYIAAKLQLPTAEHGAQYLATAITLIFLGIFKIINSKQVLLQGIGVIVIENGLFLITQAISYGMPMVVELGIFFDLFVAVIIIASLSFKISSTFNSLNTEKMQDLRG
ncbi:MAG: hydrogenase [Negativicutes bacterium]|jgi:hydrogenase-4 component E|nr:hydrogenase [Negativicutes bacterium]MBP8629425.1 hydrogenase [Negativicutes bacterium]MBP9537599.1 hydrogenase [Negativicutes bacterium]MBP9948475.1 hydrogenase [Negativicutes bacterium]